MTGDFESARDAARRPIYCIRCERRGQDAATVRRRPKAPRLTAPLLQAPGGKAGQSDRRATAGASYHEAAGLNADRCAKALTMLA